MNYPRYWFFLLIMISGNIFVSCSGENRDYGSKTAQDSVVSENTMISLLTDVHIVEAGLNTEKNQGTLTDARSDEMYRGVFRKYRITKKIYDSSLKYYSRNPKEFSKLYAKVIERIELEQTAISRKKR